ncbi:MAG: hypothetical protein AB7L76_22925, partial [Burkholderiaceae bacterium]
QAAMVRAVPLAESSVDGSAAHGMDADGDARTGSRDEPPRSLAPADAGAHNLAQYLQRLMTRPADGAVAALGVVLGAAHPERARAEHEAALREALDAAAGS